MFDDALDTMAAGDWTCRLIAGTIEAVAASTGKPYIARIVGRDPTYTWRREFLKPKWEFPARSVNPAAIVRLRLSVSMVGDIPAALEIRWGPGIGPTVVDRKTNTQSKLCAYRGFFLLMVDDEEMVLRKASDAHVIDLIDRGIVVPGRPQRPPDMRARIDFDEDV